MDVQDNKLSLLVFTFFMNTTTNNQGDHCIVAVNFLDPSKQIDNGNLALIVSQGQCLELKSQYQALMPMALQLMAGGYNYG